MVESEGTKKPWQPRRVMSEGADLSDADTGMRYVIAYSVSLGLCSNNERLDRHDQTAHTKRFFLCTKGKEVVWKEDYLHRNQ